MRANPLAQKIRITPELVVGILGFKKNEEENNECVSEINFGKDNLL
jgi:hypothetical protein